MALKEEVLQYLFDNSSEYISGEELAHSLGKSRTAVWKAIKSLQADGYRIDAVTNRGYMLDAGNDILNAQEIKKALSFDCRVEYYKTLDSTNNVAKRIIAEGEDDVLLVVGEEQTAGRGRQGKSFYSPQGTGIYMSLVVHPMIELQSAVTATTAAAVAVCRAIESLTDKKPMIKWVNDVYLDGKKICGILTEAVTDFETQTVSSVIIGVGINLTTKDFPCDVQNASCLNADVKRAELIGAVANELNRIVCSGYGEFMEYYRSHSLVVGEDIVFIKGGVSTQARALGIDDFGGLEVELADGTHYTLRSGEITVRKIK
ncbi:biotin--[acetyl-CoA-carboxylase] ligase [uncultured Eubacterium sp.]|uniref:biotin--[acetyl-CoA-carboxylase] ligase n=1 Tax=uncultured Eubacterium sp. TaxID=165185 RepID=UPI0015B80185|nr:biotin--[acetyl-CoA-carboxylase] ligase [uncultured Eubacterium sp.]